ncbi:unnamed protein product [Schistosoma mattheei]|uniref:Uncharacterized protein n=1 Tax=Schistosoma mattheei TaxID=31246 RepID=A0A183NJP4_9TREM|nr:unnamed protein product [Schistosoma mattheei]
MGNLEALDSHHHMLTSDGLQETELLSVKHELNNITIKFNEFNDSKKDEINKYETELTNRSTQLSILERQLKELKLMNKKLTEDSSILIHSNENIQSELKTIKSELDIKQKQYETNIVSQLYYQVFYVEIVAMTFQSTSSKLKMKIKGK